MLTLLFTGITVVCSILAFQDPQLIYKLMYSPYLISRQKEWYRFFSFQFVHADWMHLAFNMIAFYSFGAFLEQVLEQISILPASLSFFIIYMGGHLVGVLPQYKQYENTSNYSSIGASAGVSGVLFATILYNPSTPISLYFVFDVPAWLFGGLYLAYSYYMKDKQGDSVNHSAHHYGALFGLVAMLALAFPYFKALLEYYITQ